MAKKKQEKSVLLQLYRFTNLSIAISILDLVCSFLAIYKSIAPPNDPTAGLLITMTAYILQFHLFLIAMIIQVIPKIILPKAVALKNAEKKQNILKRSPSSEPSSAQDKKFLTANSNL